ncbi:MAG: SPOR domain-containing protein [Candidatus Omnitrophota bacterium]|jgi:hypothetical protein
MAQEETNQLELFSKEKGTQALKASASGSLLTSLWNYEKLIFLIIGFIVSGLVCYCLGVERGKKIARFNIGTPVELAVPLKDEPILQENIPPRTVEVQADATLASKKRPPSVTNELAMNITTAPKNSNSKFTIQIASYKQKLSAQKEATQLKKKGFTTTVIPLNGYSVICVGSFSNKEKAKSLLTEIRKQYRDCFIRRL